MARATSAGMRVGSRPEANRSRWLVATSTSRTKTLTSWSMMRLTDTMISSVTAVTGSLRSRRCWLTTVSITRRAAEAVPTAPVSRPSRSWPAT